MFHDLENTYLHKTAYAFLKAFCRRRGRDFYCHVTVTASCVWGVLTVTLLTTNARATLAVSLKGPVF
jgi:hypothetical protein